MICKILLDLCLVCCSRRDIPRQSYMMHSLHCARNIALCPRCDEPVPRAELEQHNRELHANIDCSLCARPVEACKLEEHQVRDLEKEIFSLHEREKIPPLLSLHWKVSMNHPVS